MLNETFEIDNTTYYSANEECKNISGVSISLDNLVDYSVSDNNESTKSITMHSTPCSDALKSINLFQRSGLNMDFTPSPVTELSASIPLNDFDLDTTADYKKHLTDFERKLDTLIFLAKHDSMADLRSDQNSKLVAMEQIKIRQAEQEAIKKYRQLKKLVCNRSKRKSKNLRIRM